VTVWGAKYAGAIARITGILHLAKYGPDEGPRKSVTAETLRDAHRIGEYFQAAAINAFSEMGTDQGTADAVYLLERIERLRRNAPADQPFDLSERDMHVAGKSRFRKKPDLLPAIERLVDHGYLSPLPPPKSTGGRPASSRYRVHTKVGTEGAEGIKP
jgi:replicative DNA helicase